MTVKSYFQPSFLLLFLRRWGLLLLALFAMGYMLSLSTAASVASHTPNPTTVTIPGSLQSELGCTGDWQPDCATTHLAYDADDEVWQGSWSVPAGNYEYKAAINDSWTENYGRYAQQGGPNIPLNLGSTTTVKFYYDHETHWVTSNKNAVIAVAVGDFQSELGCPGDWQPDCLRSWLEDLNEDGIYDFTTTALPAGNYEAKVAINESWDENYGEGGTPGGSNIHFTVSSNNAPTVFTYNSTTHVMTIGGPSPSPTPTPQITSCTNATTGDNNVYWVGLGHNSFDATYRNPTGPVPTNQGTVTLKFRTCANDVGSATVRIWNDVDNVESLLPMSPAGNDTDPMLGNVSYWSVNVSIPTTPTILYYVFRTMDGSNTAHYRAKYGNAFYGGSASTWGALGGWGDPTNNQGDAEGNSFQLTVYDPNFVVPQWMQQGIVYQIFPDRFRDGNPTNNPVQGRFFYSETGSLLRSGQAQARWNSTICDPRGIYTPGCPGIYGQNFYGGDLAGITQKINQGFFDNLGVNVLYLNPIFRSPSNHKYDTADYKVIDPDFGTLADFQTMTEAAHAHGIKIMLDGVFNHTSSDSKYFDRYSRYDANGNLSSPAGPGTNDSSGACEATTSGFRSWYYIPHFASPGRDGDPGTGPLAYCVPPDPPGTPATTYEAWYSYSSLPKLQANSPQVRQLIWSNGLSSVGPYWTQQGADGWRFDVGGDVDPGRTNDPNNDYWEGFRAAVRNAGLTGKSDVLMLGEEWGDTSPWLLGNEWDSTMNYRFRAALLSWLFTGCTDSTQGCSSDPRGEKFQENDSNDGSSSGPIGYLSPSQLDTRLRTIHEDYPPMAFKAMMNLEGSHDTQRLYFLLKKGNNDRDDYAVQRMKEWWLFAFTYPGAPTLYYGDEMGLNQDGVYSGNWQDDPYNRVPYAWGDTPGDYTSDTTNLLPQARKMSSIRLSYQALLDGDVEHGLIVSDTEKLYGFGRTNGNETALIALNRDNATHSATFSGLNAAPYNLPDGTVLRDAMTAMTSTTGMTYTVTGGTITANVNGQWGAVLLEESEIDTPASAVVTGTRTGSDVTLSWSPVVTDTDGGKELATSYEIYRGTVSTFLPDVSSKIAETAPPPFGTSDGQITFTDPNASSAAYYYIVRSCNGAGNCSDSNPVLVALGTNTATPTETTIATSTATDTPVDTTTSTTTSTATETAIPTGTATAADIPSETATESSTATATTTIIPSNTATVNPSETSTSASTSTSTATAIPSTTSTPTVAPSNTGTATGTNTATATPSVSATSTLMTAATNTATTAPSGTGTAISTATRTVTALPSSTTAASATTTATSVPTACPIQFQDVPPSNEVSSFYPYVRCLACRGVLGGYPCGSTNPQTGQEEPCGSSGNPYFRPSNLITRGQIAKVVANAAGYNEAVEGQTYADVQPSDDPSSFYVYVERLTAHNVMSGYPCGAREDETCDGQNRAFFRPSANATRAQLAKIVSNAGGFVDTVEGQTFADVPPSDAPSSFYVYVERLAQRGVMGGYPCGGEDEDCDGQNRPFFRPSNPVTRAQAAKIVANTFFPNCQTP